MGGEAKLERMREILAALRSEPAPTNAKARTRGRILRAATELFQRLGYRATNVDEVARLAGVAKGTVYLHFESKAELLFESILEEKRQLLGPFVELFEQEMEPAERLRRYIELALLAIPKAPLGAKLASGDREIFLFLEELPPERRAAIQANQSTAAAVLLDGVGAFNQLPPEVQERRKKAFLGLLQSVVT